jgi:protoporphyrinogen/coproporphyrinogen III oxidase
VSSNRKTVVIGGGISGLTAAYYSPNSIIVEAKPKLGGVLQNAHKNGCVIELGACSWLASKTAAADLVRELGLGDQLIGSNDKDRQTFIWKRGRMVKYPDGMQLVAPAKLWPILTSDLVGKFTKARILLDWFRKPSVFPPRERTVGAFVTDHFGIEMCDYVAEPLLSGLYGGDPFELSATAVLPKLVDRERFHGSLVKGLKTEKRDRPLFEAPRDGMSRLVEALTPKEWIHGEAEQIENTTTGYRVRVRIV